MICEMLKCKIIENIKKLYGNIKSDNTVIIV